MKPFAGGRLFDAKRSPFGVSLTPGAVHPLCPDPPRRQLGPMRAMTRRNRSIRPLPTRTPRTRKRTSASVIANAPLHAYRGQCTYCGHCKPCPAGLDIGMINKFYDLATMQPEVPATVRSHYEALEHTASACIGCRSCESRCPFGVPIAERMEKAAALFGC